MKNLTAANGVSRNKALANSPGHRGGVPAERRQSGDLEEYGFLPKAATRFCRSLPRKHRTARAFLLSAALLFFTIATLQAQIPDPGSWTNADYYYGKPMSAWSFNDTNTWTSDLGYAPVSFTNISASWLGDYTALVVDSDDPAWLQYNTTESSGTNNLKVDRGSVMFWFAPSWSGTNEGGAGPGVWGRLLEVGSVNSNGWWSLYVDPEGANIYFSAQTNGGHAVTYLSAPIDWTTNYWHEIALIYTATNSALYLDGELATSGLGVTNFPGADVLTNGFFIGSDSAGNNQAHGMFDDIYTYDYPITYSTVSVEELTGELTLRLNRLNSANFVPSAPSTPSPTVYNIIAGPGYLQYVGASGSCVTNSNVWLTNASVTITSNPMTFNFTIAGGTNGVMYDVFACPALTPQLTNGLWAWMGQGNTCSTYSIPSLPTTGAVYFLLGGTRRRLSCSHSPTITKRVWKISAHIFRSVVFG